MIFDMHFDMQERYQHLAQPSVGTSKKRVKAGVQINYK